jgi:hypothetical protein
MPVHNSTMRQRAPWWWEGLTRGVRLDGGSPACAGDAETVGTRRRPDSATRAHSAPPGRPGALEHLADLLRQLGQHVVDLARAYVPAQDACGGRCRHGGLRGVAQVGAIRQPGEERVAVADFLGLMAGIEALVEDTPQEMGQLGGQLGCLVDRQSVAQHLEVGPQDAPRQRLISAIQLAREVLHPLVGLVCAVLNRLNGRSA